MVNIEYELTQLNVCFMDVNILLLLGTSDPPVINSIDGIYKHNPKTGVLCWHMDMVNGNNPTVSLEFVVPGADTSLFFPIRIWFTSQTLFCLIEIINILFTKEENSPIPYNLTSNFIPETYEVA